MWILCWKWRYFLWIGLTTAAIINYDFIFPGFVSWGLEAIEFEFEFKHTLSSSSLIYFRLMIVLFQS